MLKKAFVIMLLAALAVSCRQGREPAANNEEDAPGAPGVAAPHHDLTISDELLGEIIYSFSPIVEIPALISDLGVPWSGSFLVPAGQMPQPATDIGNAVLMGILGPGMGYQAMGGETDALPGYITAMRRAASGIEADHLFDFDNIEQLAMAQADPGMLSFSFMQSYNRTDEHLRQSQMTHLSTAMVAGMWIEGLYLLTRAAAEQPEEELYERIGEQKIILNELIIMLRSHQRSHPGFAPLTAMLEGIKEEFDKVEIVYEVDEPQALERDGMLVVVQNQRSYVNIDRQQVTSITASAENIRNNIITQ